MDGGSSTPTGPTIAVSSGTSVASAVVERAGVAYRAVSKRADDAWVAVTQLQLNWADVRAPRRAALVGFAATVAAVTVVAIAAKSNGTSANTAAASKRSVKPAPLPPPRERHVRNDVPAFLERRRRLKEWEAAQSKGSGDQRIANIGTSTNTTVETDTNDVSTVPAGCHAPAAAGNVATGDDALATDLLGTQEPSGCLACDEVCSTLRTRQNRAIKEALDALPDHAVDKEALAIAVNVAIDADTDGNMSNCTATLEHLEAVLRSLAPGLPPTTA